MENVRMKNRSAVNHGSRQRGASLLEGIAYLGIAALVILGAVSLLTGAFGSAQGNRAAEEVVSIRTAVRKLYMGHSASYAPAAMNPTLIPANIFPSTLTTNAATGTVTNSWNGNVVVAGAGGTFTVSYANVPQDVCVTLVGTSTGWTQVAVNGGAAILPANLTPAAAQGACNAATNTVVWTAT